MSGGIYLIQGDDQLVEMSEQPYNSEALLQELLETYPNLLAVDSGSNGKAKSWLMVTRTAGLPAEEMGLERWSLNHLFLDSQAIPTLVEVKSQSDSRTRREVVGQMLDYAANAVLYWPVESILSQFEANCRNQNRDPEQVFEDFLGIDTDEDKFWQQVKTNLQAGKIRLIFVVNAVTPDLQRLIEFLNEQMDPAEVLAVEVKQYVSQEDDLKTLVSRVIGQTAEAQKKKSSTSRERRQWDHSSFLSEYKARYGSYEAGLVNHLYQWAESRQSHLCVQWGTGDVYGGFAVKLNDSERNFPELFFLGINGELQISSDNYAALPPFKEEEDWQTLRSKLSSIGLALPTEASQKRLPNFQLSTLSDDTALQQVITTFNWVVDQVI